MSNPALLLIVGGLLTPLLSGRWRAAWMLLLPAAGMVLLWTAPESAGQIQVFELTLEPLRVDRLARLFGTAFHVATLLSVVYALHLRDALQQATILVYAGAAVGTVLAGDLLTLFLYWELAGLSSVFLILARRTERAVNAGIRYLAAQVLSGVLLLGGIALRAQAGYGLEFDLIGIADAAGWLILLAIGIKAAFPVLHTWLQDTYPEATVVGTVVLSAFTTKMAIYALIRGYAGTEQLIWVGAVMTCFPIFYAVIENDLRRVLAYSMINQLGFMVVGVGVGGALGINGAAAHAFADILFKGLLFMSMGAVLHRTGTVKGSELGGLYKSMPQTAALCVVGAASISAFPLFSGFVTKSMIIEAIGDQHLTLIWLMLLFASAGVFHHAGIKIPYFAFFAHDRGHRVEEAPLNMRVAMALAAAGCVLIGVAPGLLYGLLPLPVEYVPYTIPHVVNQTQLLLLSAMAFTVLVRTGIYPPELRSVNLDVDAVYRKAMPATARWGLSGAGWLRNRLAGATRAWATVAASGAADRVRDGNWLALRTTGEMIWWVALLLGAYLVISLF